MSETATHSKSLDETDAFPPRGADLEPATDFVDYIKEYAKQKPEVAALWCFGVGFIVGWKLKPW